MSSTIFSVVDIETTGTSQSNNNRIIQFSCTFVKNKTIIGSFNSFINPEMEIPDDITKLTGITNELVKNAPTFEEIANKIYSLLSNTIFVAHNVNFDFPFINSELSRIDIDKLEIMAIDTVTLSQLLLPTEKSYRLIDLSKNLNILHKHPHSSSSDALATAKLLIILLNQIEKMPKKTIKKIIKINPALPMDTMDVFKNAYNNIIDKDNDKLIDINTLKIRKIQYKNSQKLKDNIYPSSKDKKKHLFGGINNFSDEQNKLMNSIYNNYKFSKQSKNLLMETNDELDDDFSYLFPLSYLIGNNKKIVVSVHKHKLHGDLSKVINKINKISQNNLKKIVLHSSDDYIDLNKFRDALSVVSGSKRTEFLKCKILIWLTFTKTGDLHELNVDMNNEQNSFLKIIGNINNKGYYINKLKSDLKNSNIIVISHEFLFNNIKSIAKYHPYLIVKDANQFNEQLLRHYRVNFQINQNKILIHHVQYLLYQTHNKNLYDVFNNSTKNHYIVKQIDDLLKSYEKLTARIQESFSKKLIKKDKLINKDNIYINQIDNSDLYNFFNNHKIDIQNQHSILNKINVLRKKLISVSEIQIEDKAILNDFNDHFIELEKFFNNNITLIAKLIQNNNNVIFENDLNIDKNVDNSLFRGGLINNKNLLNQIIYKYISNILFMDDSLYTRGNLSPILNKLELETKNTLILNNRGSNDLSKDYKVLLNGKKDKIDLDKLNLDQENVFIMANTQSSINDIYKNLIENDCKYKSVILSQKINGNKEKIIKKFTNSKKSIIIGNYDLFLSIRDISERINCLIFESFKFNNLYLDSENKNLPIFKLMIKNSIKHLIELSNVKGTILLNNINYINDIGVKDIRELLPNNLKLKVLSIDKIIKQFNNN
ncbi:hypothetical protein MOO46_01850 [Apilactobacillus apisilvae]|uniref:Exonuclease domain-containing protein n=1 Tax=Apilactobacillus apisilvae TaxID=2923364 RepID=A0ABY4PIC1_9LACO|nr:exonuclease domain-containing protein [Apilactobacillus apisilvae]UQS85358.1 hypothetical protein MOO46_01850 [Apilactobacillus apisilvae]